MSTEKDFLDLLSSLAQEQHYTIDFPRQNEDVSVKFKSLTTIQLKELVKTAVDSPLTQSVFNSTATKVFKSSIASAPADTKFNVVDRLIFLLETRIQTISPTKKVKTDDKEIEVNYPELLNALKEAVKSKIKIFTPTESVSDKLTVTYGIPLIDTEVQLEEEVYKNVEIKVDTAEDLRKIVGESFINEIAKAVHAVTVGEKTVVLSEIPFKSRLKIVETLPASVIQTVVEYIESYKNVVTASLTVNKYTAAIDSTLFSV